MREEGFSQAQGRTVITCTIDTTTLILWMCPNAAFGGRINLFSPTNHSQSPQYEVISLCVSFFVHYVLISMGFICCLDSVLNDRRLDWILLHHVDHVQTCTIVTTTLISWEQQNAAFGGRINNYSPTNHSLSSVRGHFSLLSAFLFIIFWCVYSLCDVSTSFWLREGLVLTKENLFLQLGE